MHRHLNDKIIIEEGELPRCPSCGMFGYPMEHTPVKQDMQGARSERINETGFESSIKHDG
jgi:hypothetical protein